MTHILRFHTEIGKMPVVLDLCPWPWPRLASPWPWPWPRLVCPWPRQNFEVLGLDLDLKFLGLTTKLSRIEKLFKYRIRDFRPLNLKNLFPKVLNKSNDEVGVSSVSFR